MQESNNKIVKEAQWTAAKSVTSQQFAESFEKLPGNKPDEKLLGLIDEFKKDLVGFITKGGAYAGAAMADVLSITANIPLLGTITLDPSKKAAVESSKATELNTFNNIAWAATARKQLATSNDQLKV